LTLRGFATRERPPDRAVDGDPREPSSDPVHRIRRAAETCRILVVDDDELIRATVTGILLQEGYRVETATNGSDALDSLDRISPDIVLLDMRMPVIDGWGFARIVRERRLGVRIVVMTAAQDARRRAEEIAADAYLSKPFDLDELIAVMERICSNL